MILLVINNEANKVTFHVRLTTLYFCKNVTFETFV